MVLDSSSETKLICRFARDSNASSVTGEQGPEGGLQQKPMRYGGMGGRRGNTSLRAQGTGFGLQIAPPTNQMANALMSSPGLTQEAASVIQMLMNNPNGQSLLAAAVSQVMAAGGNEAQLGQMLQDYAMSDPNALQSMAGSGFGTQQSGFGAQPSYGAYAAQDSKSYGFGAQQQQYGAAAASPYGAQTYPAGQESYGASNPYAGAQQATYGAQRSGFQAGSAYGQDQRGTAGYGPSRSSHGSVRYNPYQR